MKYYINLKTQEKTQASNKALEWYKQGCNIAIMNDKKIVNKWIREKRAKK
jgi:hypothetical protein